MAAVSSQYIFHGQIFIETFPMNTESAPNELPAGTLVRGARLKPRKKNQRHAHLLGIVERDGQKITGKRKVLNSDAIHRKGSCLQTPYTILREIRRGAHSQCAKSRGVHERETLRSKHTSSGPARVLQRSRLVGRACAQAHTGPPYKRRTYIHARAVMVGITASCKVRPTVSRLFRPDRLGSLR